MKTVREHPQHMAICCGDLFDRHSNPEEILRDALPIVQATTFILAGNHDLVNREDKVGSLKLLEEFYSNKILTAKWGVSEEFYYDVDQTRLIFIPHLSSQELFEQSLQNTVRLVTPGKYNLLVLHCNYDRNYPEMQETALNLTRPLIEMLLPHFHYILLGHEHTPVEYHGGKVKVIGNLHPTGFGDISDKRVLEYDTDSGRFNSLPVFAKDELYVHVKASQLQADGIDRHDTVPFISVFDDLEPGKANKLVNQLFAKSKTVCGVRVQSKEVSLETKQVQRQALESLPKFIGRDLQVNHPPELYQLWTELSGRL